MRKPHYLIYVASIFVFSYKCLGNIWALYHCFYSIFIRRKKNSILIMILKIIISIIFPLDIFFFFLFAVGNRMVDRRRSGRHLNTSVMASAQSITYKGAVAMTQLSGGGVMAANASLYTVLVTDQPIERLRLKRPLGNMEFWHQRNEGTDPLGLQATHTDELDAMVPSQLGPGGSSSFPSLSQLEEPPTPAPPRVMNSGGSGSPLGSPTDLEQGLSQGLGLNVNSFNSNGTGNSSLEGTPPRKPAFHRGTSVLQDPGAIERGIGLSSGWSATWNGVKQWWRHRGRYKEWRRDVRWAMFNKRVRTATEMFSELFGDDFDAIVPIYPTESVDRVIHEWDKAAAALERAQMRLREISEEDTYRVGPLRDQEEEKKWWQLRKGASAAKIKRLKSKIATLAEKTATLQEQISTERDSILSDLPSTCFFATFKSQEAAAIAAQANLNPITQRLFDVQAAPSPDDVNWPALERSWWQRQARPAYVIPLILFIMLLPIGAFTGAFAQLTIAFCGNPENPGPAADQWFCSDDRWAVFFRNLLTSIAPSLLLSLYHLVVLPVLVYYAAQAEGRCFSLSQLDRRCADLFFYW